MLNSVKFWSGGQTLSQIERHSPGLKKFQFLYDSSQKKNSKQTSKTPKGQRVAPLHYSWRKRWTCYLNAKARVLFQVAKELKCRPPYLRTRETTSPTLHGCCIQTRNSPESKNVYTHSNLNSLTTLKFNTFFLGPLLLSCVTLKHKSEKHPSSIPAD